MNKILSAIIILAFLISTVTAVVVRPTLYKQVLFSPAEVEVQNTESEIKETEIHLKEIKPLEKTEEKIKIAQHNGSQETKRIINSAGNKNNKTVKAIKTPQQENTVKEQKVKTASTPKLPESIKKILNPQNEETKSVKTETHEQAQKTKEQPEKVQTQEIPVQTTPQVIQLTEQEEIIVWNRWRSNLQNKVMRDVKIDAPLGTRFRFSFTVDRYGQISNLKVWSDNPEYTSLAIRQIKPLLLSYQGQPVLKFPQGTKRIVTNVTGGFVLATFDKYSKPSDYSDIERVKYLR